MLDSSSLLATSGSYGYNPTTHSITWTGHVSSATPVTISYRVQTDPAAIFGQYITNTAVISDETTVFARTVTALVARQTYLPAITRKPLQLPLK
jgi:hypothetical protein